LANIGRSYLRPNIVGDPNNGPKDVDNWFNANAFERPQPYTFGTASAYVANADGIIGFDIAVQKKFPINERHSMEFRTEFFNFPNTPSFGDPQSNMNNGNYNRVSGTRSDSRQIQFGLRWRF
jgi:hypothetical protein